MPDEPLVSIVIPTYRRPELLGTALRSATAQTYRRLEIVVCDDADDPATAAIVEQHGDDRVRYIPRRPHLGMLRNTVDGVVASRGDLVTTLHDDDFLEPAAIERLVAPLVHDPGLVLSFCDATIVDADGRPDPEATERNSRTWGRAALPGGRMADVLVKEVREQFIPTQLGTLFRRSAVPWDGFPDEVATVYDFWLAYLAVGTGRPIHYVPERLTNYRVHGQSETALGAERTSRALLFAYGRMAADPRLAGIRPFLRAGQAGAARTVGRLLLRSDATEARRFLATSLRHRPNPKTVALLLRSFLPVRARG